MSSAIDLDTPSTRRAHGSEWRLRRVGWVAMLAVVALGVSLGEGLIVLRAVALYAAMLAILRVSGKRTLGEMTPFDFVLLLMLSELTQPSIVGSEGNLGTGLLAIVVLVGADIVAGFATWKSKGLDKLMNGAPLVIVRNGETLDDRLAAEHIEPDEVLAAARRVGLTRMDQIELAVLETDGDISIVPAPSRLARFRRRSRTS